MLSGQKKRLKKLQRINSCSTYYRGRFDPPPHAYLINNRSKFLGNQRVTWANCNVVRFHAVQFLEYWYSSVFAVRYVVWEAFMFLFVYFFLARLRGSCKNIAAFINKHQVTRPTDTISLVADYMTGSRNDSSRLSRTKNSDNIFKSLLYVNFREEVCSLATLHFTYLNLRNRSNSMVFVH